MQFKARVGFLKRIGVSLLLWVIAFSFVPVDFSGVAIPAARADDAIFNSVPGCTFNPQGGDGINTRYRSGAVSDVRGVSTTVTSDNRLSHTFVIRGDVFNASDPFVALYRKVGSGPVTSAGTGTMLAGSGGFTFQYKDTEVTASTTEEYAFVVAVSSGGSAGTVACILFNESTAVSAADAAANPIPPCPTNIAVVDNKTDPSLIHLSWSFTWKEKPASAKVYFRAFYIEPAASDPTGADSRYPASPARIRVPKITRTVFVLNAAYAGSGGREIISTGCKEVEVTGTEAGGPASMRYDGRETKIDPAAGNPVETRDSFCGKSPQFYEIGSVMITALCEIVVLFRNLVTSIISGSAGLLGQVSGIPGLKPTNGVTVVDTTTATSGFGQILSIIASSGGLQNLITESPTATSGITIPVIARRLASLMQGLVNALVLILLILAAFSNIFSISVGAYGIKKLLPGVLIGFLLSNASIFITRVGLEFVGVVANTVMSSDPITGSITTSTPADKIIASFTNVAGGGYLTVDGTGTTSADLGRVINQGIINIIALVGAIVLFCLAFMFIIRSIILLALVPIAPIAFFGIAASPLSFAWKSWSKNFIQWAFAPVIAVFWIWLATAITVAISTPTAVSVEAGALASASLPALIAYAGAVFCLFQAVRTPFKVQSDFKGVVDKWGKFGKSIYGTGATAVTAAGARSNAKILGARQQIAVRKQVALDERSASLSNLEKATEDRKKAVETRRKNRQQIAELSKKINSGKLTSQEIADAQAKMQSLGADNITLQQSAAKAKETQVAEGRKSKLLSEEIKDLNYQDRIQKAKMFTSPTLMYAVNKQKMQKAWQSYMVDPAKKSDEITNAMAELDLSKNAGIYARGKAAQKNIDAALGATKQANSFLIDNSAYVADTEGAKMRKDYFVEELVTKNKMADDEKEYIYGARSGAAHSLITSGQVDQGFDKLKFEQIDKDMSSLVAAEGTNLGKPVKPFKEMEAKVLSGVINNNSKGKYKGVQAVKGGAVSASEVGQDKYIKGLGNLQRGVLAMQSISKPENQEKALLAAAQFDELAAKVMPGVKIEINAGVNKSYDSYSAALAAYQTAGDKDRKSILSAISNSPLALAVSEAAGSPGEAMKHTFKNV